MCSGRRLEPSNGAMEGEASQVDLIRSLGLRLWSNFAAVNVSEFLVRLYLRSS
jgi:hypothetical protein